MENYNDTLPGKLYNLSKHLQLWEKEIFGSLTKKKRRLEARISGAQKVLELDPNNTYLFDLENSLNNELEIILDQEETYWYTRSSFNGFLKVIEILGIFTSLLSST